MMGAMSHKILGCYAYNLYPSPLYTRYHFGKIAWAFMLYLNRLLCKRFPVYFEVEYLQKRKVSTVLKVLEVTTPLALRPRFR